MSYTTQEIAAAVEKLVRTSIRRTQGTLGNREVGVTFNDYQDAAAGMFILHQNAPFYLIYVATRNLIKALQLQQEVIDEFTGIVEATDRRVTPIRNLSPLANARVALDGLLLASASRTSSFDSIEDVPAYQRFESNTQQFLDESSKNIREDGDIVRTPDEARGLLAGYYRTLKAAHEDVIRRVEILESAMVDFNVLQLPSSLVNAILENSRDSIQGWYTTLAGVPEQDRLKLIRDATLAILAARSTVAGFGSLSGPTIFVPIEGSGQVFADATHPAIPAEVSSTLLGPYVILEESPIIHFELEGDATAVEVQGSFVAAIEATLHGPFTLGHPNDLTGGSGGTNNSQLVLQMLNFTSWGSSSNYIVEFDELATYYEAWEVAGFINNVIPTGGGDIPIICEVYAQPLRFGGGCDITFVSGITHEFESINSTTDFSALGIIEDAYILVPPQDPQSLSQNAVYRVPTGGVGTTKLQAQLIFHPGGLSGSALDELAIDVRITNDALALRLRITGANDIAAKWNGSSWTEVAKPDMRVDALNNRWGFAIPAEGPETGARVLGDVDLTGLALPAAVVGKVMTIAVDGSGAQSIDLTGFVGTTPASLAAEIDSQMTTGNCTVSVDDFIRFHSSTVGEDSLVSITAGDLLDVLFTGGVAGVPYENAGLSAAEAQFNGATALGFYPGVEVLCARTPASVIADNITAGPAAAIGGVARVEAETYLSATAYSGRGRTDPFDQLRVIASLFEATSVVATNLGGNSYSFAATGAATAGVTTTSVLVVRASSDPGDIGLYAVVTLVDDTEVQTTLSQALQGGLSDLDIECGPDLTVPGSLSHNASAVITDSPINDGQYGVLDTGSVPFELSLDTPMVIPAGAANLPLYFDLEVGFYGVTFKSLDTTLATEVTLNDNGGDPTSASDRFFGSLPVTRPGTTSYFQLPEWNNALNAGDMLEIYSSQFDTPASTNIIASLEPSSFIIQLETELVTSSSAVAFGEDVPIPFARIRNSRSNTFVILEDGLRVWLGLAANQDAYFKELLRLLNPLTVNTNPTVNQVNDVKNQLTLLDSTVLILEGLLDDYHSDVVPQIDVLLTSLQEKGADRARDILLEAQFGTFFGLNMDETSYSGTVQGLLKEINREDLPIRKDNRTGLNAGAEELLGEYDEPDFEYDISDLDEAEELDIPAGSTY